MVELLFRAFERSEQAFLRLFRHGRLALPVPFSANVAQLVEHIHGKDEVSSSILDIGSHTKKHPSGCFLVCEPNYFRFQSTIASTPTTAPLRLNIKSSIAFA